MELEYKNLEIEYFIKDKNLILEVSPVEFEDIIELIKNGHAHYLSGNKIKIIFGAIVGIDFNRAEKLILRDIEEIIKNFINKIL